MTVSLEDQAAQVRGRIARLEKRLEDLNQRIHKRKVRESGLLGKIARSDRVLGGVVIDDVTFKTWAPNEPQAVTGRRMIGNITTTIHVTSEGFWIDDADTTRVQP